MVSRSAVVCLVVIAAVSATDVSQCPGKSLDDLSSKVQLSPCKKLPCKLKKGTSQHITIKFKPDTNIEAVKNSVKAEVFGVPLPFVGVDGNSICDKVFLEDGTKAVCPLKAGESYLYKDAFPILSFYPNIEAKVHWALKANGKEIVCFEVPVRIQ